MKKKILLLLILFSITLVSKAQGCISYFETGKSAIANYAHDEKKLLELEKYFLNIDATCKNEIGNSAALCAEHVRDLRNKLIEARRCAELRRKEEEKRLKEEERRELERIQREREERIANNLLYIEGYGLLKDNTNYPIVNLIKGNLSKQYNYKYAQNSEKAVWGIFIAVDSRDVHIVENTGQYMAYAVPMMLIKNLVTGEVLYEGSGLEFSENYKGEDAKYSLGRDELATIRSAFRKVIDPLSLTISNYILYE